MRVFEHLPFKWKLTLMLMITSVFSLLVACAAFVWYDNYLFRQSMVRDVETLANIISKGSQAALASRNKDAVETTLAELGRRDQIVAAAVYSADETPFGFYLKPGSRETVPPTPSRLQNSFEGDYLVIFRPIVSHQRRIGTLYLKADFADQVRGRVNRYIDIAGM